ncbi:DEAD/DEAH box helicase [Jeotgalibaca ciconiae]|uniref:DEAD/DEAH box helicase n=1 Tax=Jeotgalibaca ciconiae TaxID=2496265 RepID=A0A3Q9BKX2_9LACT|nr:DEAD/DEAH box helicase [Jeotgalibaca ciconiae]AZP04748.1 DEAD/DEAH box helicase [Jeotgalibaca ciconiae]
MMIEKMDTNFQRYWKGLRFQLPTPIQEYAFEPLREGKDVVGLSPTGTGKTLAYALPLLERVEKGQGIQLIVLTPSQELGVQVGRVITEWASLLDLKVQTIIGGANVKRQIEKLKEKPEVIVGTPGRLMELASQRKLKLHQVKAVVLDEADYLLHQEHLSTLRELIKKMPGQRQLAFFSATSSEEVQNVSRWFNTDPLYLDAEKEGRMMDQTAHRYILAENRKRAEMLRRLGHVKDMQALVFVNSVQELDYLAEKMHFEKVPVRVMHSDFSTNQRKKSLEEFRKGSATFLLTTDVTARGMDIEDLPYVINYDLPLTQEVYLHRSGRTGRMGKKGTVLSLVNERSLRDVKKFVPKSDDFKEVFLYGGKVVTELPKSEEQHEEVVKRSPRATTKEVKPNFVATEPQKEVKKAKKKNRTRDQKNKGARKK